jgi:hypothetical protein
MRARFSVVAGVGFAVAVTMGSLVPSEAATNKEKEKEPSHAGGAAQATVPPPSEASSSPYAGRFQLVVVPGHSGSPFLLDTATGCLWHQIQHQETKRTTFVEIDVENLHWSWGSGSQQLLASRIDGAGSLNDQQKRMLKESLQKTACGLSNVVLTPGPPPGQAPAQTPPASQPTP